MHRSLPHPFSCISTAAARAYHVILTGLDSTIRIIPNSRAAYLAVQASTTTGSDVEMTPSFVLAVTFTCVPCLPLPMRTQRKSTRLDAAVEMDEGDNIDASTPNSVAANTNKKSSPNKTFLRTKYSSREYKALKSYCGKLAGIFFFSEVLFGAIFF